MSLTSCRPYCNYDFFKILINVDNIEIGRYLSSIYRLLVCCSPIGPFIHNFGMRFAETPVLCCCFSQLLLQLCRAAEIVWTGLSVARGVAALRQRQRKSTSAVQSGQTTVPINMAGTDHSIRSHADRASRVKSLESSQRPSLANKIHNLGTCTSFTMTSLCTYVAYRTGLTKKIIDDLISTVVVFGNSCLFIRSWMSFMGEFNNWTYKFEIYTHK